MKIPAFACLFLATRTHAVFRSVCHTFTHAFMDPIVNLGSRAAHEHSVTGSLGFADLLDVAAMTGNLTTCNVPGDHSNY